MGATVPDEQHNRVEQTATVALRRVGRRGGRRGRGMALLLVLMIVAIGGVLAMRYLRVASMRSTGTQDLIDAKRAELLAESGIAEAAYWLRHPELTSNALWTGVASRKLDANTSDYYKVTVASQSGTTPPRYTVTSEGHIVVGAADRMSRAVTAEFTTHYGFPDAVTADNALTVPSCITIIGSVYADGLLTNAGYIDGNVATTSGYLNVGTIKGRTNTYCSGRYLGSYPTNSPITYVYQNTAYTAQSISADSNANATWSSNIANPMGVWHRNGSLHLSGTITVNGTLVVNGEIHLAPNTTMVIRPKAGFPALVVASELSLENDYNQLTADGVVMIGGYLKTLGAMSHSRLRIKGGLVFTGGGRFGSFVGDDLDAIIEHDPTRTDISGLYSSQPRWTAGIIQTRYSPAEP